MFTLNYFFKRFTFCFLLCSTAFVSANSLLYAAQTEGSDRELFIEVFNKSHLLFREDKSDERNRPAAQDKEERFQSISRNINLAKHYAKAEGNENALSNAYFNDAVEETKRLNDQEILLFTLVQRGFYFYRMRKITMAMPDFLEAMFILERDPSLNPPFGEEVYKQIGFFMGTIGDYKKGNQFLTKSLSLSTNTSERATLNDNLGFFAVKAGEYELAKQYFDEAWALALEAKDVVRQAKIIGNKALLEIHYNREDEAIRLFQEDIRISRENNAELNSLYATNLLAGLLINKGDYKTAEQYLLAVKGFADKHENLIVHREGLNKHLLAIAIFEGDERREIRQRRLLAGMQDSLNLFDGENVNRQARWLAEKEIINEDLRLASLQHTAEKRRYIFAVLGFVLVLGFAFFVFLNYLSKRRKSENRFYQESLSEIAKERQLLDKELSSSQASLNRKIESLEEKNRKVERLLLSLKDGLSTDVLTAAGLTPQSVGNTHLLTDENWNQFKISFAAEYPDCYNELRDNFTELSESNLRVALLWKLKLSTKEIGQVLGVGMEAVKKSRQRLRRKMGEERYQELLNFMEVVELQ